MIAFSILSEDVKQIQVWKSRKKDVGYLLHPKFWCFQKHAFLQRACYRVWEINMGVCPRMEFYEIMCINCLGSDCSNIGVFPCKFNSTGKL